MQISVGSTYQNHAGNIVTILSVSDEGEFEVTDGDIQYRVDSRGIAVDAGNVYSLADSPSDCDTCASRSNTAAEAPRNACLSFSKWQPVALPAARQSKDTNPKDLIGVRKAPLSVIPAGVLFDIGLAMHEGAVKYGRHNYRVAGVRASVYYDAAMGHLADWWEGDDIDLDSGLSHVTKAMASLVVLRDAMMQGKLTDDRPPRSKVFKRDFNAQAGEIIDRYADRAPRHYTIADSTIEIPIFEQSR